jgi:anti-sigma factor RsiW
VNCDQARELLSAAADGEAHLDERRAVHRHVDSCPSCAAHAADIIAIDRLVRVRPAEDVPDLVRAVTTRTRPARLGRGGWLRPALAWLAVVIAAQNLPALVLGNSAGTDAHVSRHLGAFGVALAVGFAFAAWKPQRAFGLLPLVGALVVTMVLSTAFDVLDGGRSALAESVHVTELVGLALLWMIAGSPGWHGLPRRLRSARSPLTH